MRWYHWSVAGLLIVVFWLVAWAVHFPRTFIPSDDALYVLLSRSIRDFTYRETWVVGAPIHAHYPPAYPLSLALVGGIFGENWKAFVTLNAILAAGALVLVFDAARRIWHPWLAIGVLLTAVLNYDFALWTTQFVVAEAQYTFLATLALWLLLVHPGFSRRVLAWSAVVVILATLSRIVGLALVAALGLSMLIERRWKASAVFGAVVALTVGAWLTWSAIGSPPAADEERNYLAMVTHQPAELAAPTSLVVRIGRRAVNNAFNYLAHAVPSSLELTTVAGTVVDNAFWMLLLIGFSTAGLLTLFGRWRVASLYLPIYMAVLLLWPWPIERMLVPVLPLIILVFLGGGWEVLRRLLPRVAPGLLAILVSVLAVGSGAALGRMPDCAAADPSGSGCQPANRVAYAAAARFVRDSLEQPGAVLASRAHTFSLQSGRSVVPVYRLRGEEAIGFVNGLRASGVRFVVVSTVHADDRILASLLSESCSEFELVRRFAPTTLLFELDVEEAEAGVGSCEAMEEHWRFRERLRQGAE